MSESDPVGSQEPSDEEMRKLLKPCPSAEQLLVVLQKSYAVSGQEIKFKKELDSYDDRNVWVEIGGKNYVAKAHNGVESKDFIELSKKGEHEKSVIYLQNAILEHLSTNGFHTSTPQPTLEHELGTAASIHALPVMSKDHCPCDLVVRLLGWVDGTIMANAKLLPLESLADAGRYLGRLDKTLAELDTSSLEAAKRFHQWDGKNTMELKKFVDCIQDPRRKALVESILEAFQREIIDSKVSESFQTSIIHGDFNDANILVDSNFFVTGVIDFGDAVESWRVLDLTVAMAYAMLSVHGKKSRSIAAAAALLRGYNSVNPLTEQERRHLILLIASRLACSVTLGAYSYQKDPENEYLLLHAIPGWEALDLIWGTDEIRREEMKTVLNRVFDQACDAQVDPDAQVMDCFDLSFPDPAVGDPMKEVRALLVDNNGRQTKRRRSTFQ